MTTHRSSRVGRPPSGQLAATGPPEPVAANRDVHGAAGVRTAGDAMTRPVTPPASPMASRDPRARRRHGRTGRVDRRPRVQRRWGRKISESRVPGARSTVPDSTDAAAVRLVVVTRKGPWAPGIRWGEDVRRTWISEAMAVPLPPGGPRARAVVATPPAANGSSSSTSVDLGARSTGATATAAASGAGSGRDVPPRAVGGRPGHDQRPGNADEGEQRAERVEPRQHRIAGPTARWLCTDRQRRFGTVSGALGRQPDRRCAIVAVQAGTDGCLDDTRHRGRRQRHAERALPARRPAHRRGGPMSRRAGSARLRRSDP